jgi:glutamate-1-semialdehyde aminotransferase
MELATRSAVILNMGCTPPKRDYLRAVREIYNKNGALLIFDEAKTCAKIAHSRLFYA